MPLQSAANQTLNAEVWTWTEIFNIFVHGDVKHVYTLRWRRHVIVKEATQIFHFTRWNCEISMFTVHIFVCEVILLLTIHRAASLWSHFFFSSHGIFVFRCDWTNIFRASRHHCFNFASCALHVNNSVADLFCCVYLWIVLWTFWGSRAEVLREPDIFCVYFFFFFSLTNAETASM